MYHASCIKHGRRPSLEDELQWKTTFGGRRHFVEDNLRWKTTFAGTDMEKVSSSLAVLAEKKHKKDLNLEFHQDGNLKMQICWRKTFHFFHVCAGRQPSLEDTLHWKMSCGGRRPLVEDNLWWKTTCGEKCSGKRPSAEDGLCCILACCLRRFAAFFFKYPKN